MLKTLLKCEDVNSRIFVYIYSKLKPMKKLLLLSLFLISLGIKSQPATSPNQVIEIGKLNNIYNALTTSVGSNTFQLTTTTSSATTNGSVTAGARTILFETSGDFSGIIDGLRFLGDGFLSYPPQPNGIYPAIQYTVSAGTLYIRKTN